MAFDTIDGATTPILRCVAPITSLDDALALIAAAHDHDASKVLLDEAFLPPAFFDLQTRFAGEFIQKLMNYRLYVAAVFRGDDHAERFREFVREARTGRQFRTFDDEASAVRWLDGSG